MVFWRPHITSDKIIQKLQSLLTADTAVESAVVDHGHVLVTLAIDPNRAKALEQLRQQMESHLAGMRGVRSARVILTAQRQPAQAAPPTPPPAKLLPHVARIVAVASAKGGVGKSTVAANMAVSLAQSGLCVGLLDADIYGPSAPTLFGLRGAKPTQNNDGTLQPIMAHGVAVMSMGFLVAEETPMVWRGPMVQSALLQLIRDVHWGALDVLVLDMPPGTGDTQLTIAQKLPLAGAVIVSTPQDLALVDTAKGVDMFRQMRVPIIGVVENMSVFCCPNCGQNSDIFGAGGAEKRSAAMGVPFLGALPLHPALRVASDNGTPQPTPELNRVADQVAAFLAAPVKPPPRIVIE